MSLTIAPSPFGSLVVSVAETGSTLSVSTVATSPAVLSMALGVPGPTGATGAQGPAGTNGTNGTNGVGVPTGGSAGQVLAKINSTNYNTQWVNAGLPLTGGTVSGTIIVQDQNYPTNGYVQINAGTYPQLKVYNGDGVGMEVGDGININTPIFLSGGASIQFPDSSIQTTAFPPIGGTTSQYIRGDGSLYTFPAIPSIAGLLVASNNLSDVSNSTTARTNLGLGTMSTEPASAYLSTASAVANYQTIAGMSAYLSTSAAASTYQTQSGMSAYLSTSAAASTYQTQSGMSAYLSTSAASATYLTQSNASSTYLTQSNASSTYLTQANASTTYIGTSAYATTAQALTGLSTSTVISPSTALDSKFFAGGKFVNQITWTNATSGTGANSFAQNANGRYVNAPTTATGYGIASAILANNSKGSIYNSGFDFSKRVVFGARFARNVTTADANSIFRYSIGKSSSTDASDLSTRGLMIKVAGGGALQLLVHNGTTLTTTTSSFTPSNGQSYDVVVVSDGSGNVTLYVNGSSVATSTGGPTTAGTANAGQLTFEVQNTATITSGQAQSICGSDFFVHVAQ